MDSVARGLMSERVVFSEISPHAFSKFDKLACMVDSAKDFPWCFFEYLSQRPT